MTEQKDEMIAYIHKVAKEDIDPFYLDEIFSVLVTILKGLQDNTWTTKSVVDKLTTEEWIKFINSFISSFILTLHSMHLDEEGVKKMTEEVQRMVPTVVEPYDIKKETDA